MNWLDRTVPERWQGPFLILVVLGLLAVFGIIAFEQMNEDRARAEVLSALNDISPNASVTINGKAQPIMQVLEALRTLHHVDPHHSSPGQPIRVQIRDGSKTIDLVVARDSERFQEYWVFKPGWNYHNNPLGEELGAIQTDVFKDY
jgi:hypothetical protein